MKDRDRGKRVPECCQDEGRCRGSSQRWCTLGRVHRDRSCTPCVTALSPPPTVGLSAYYRGMEDISCPRSTINAIIIILTVCSMDQMTVFGPTGRDKILSTRSDANGTILLCWFLFCFCPFLRLKLVYKPVVKCGQRRNLVLDLNSVGIKCFSYFAIRLPFSSSDLFKFKCWVSVMLWLIVLLLDAFWLVK